jgi:putative ABC transport system permease protein
MRLVLLALRNLARNRRRTFLSLLVVAAGSIALLLTAGFVATAFTGLREALIHGGLGHLEVATAEALAGSRIAAERSIEQGLVGWETLRAEVEKVPGVRGAGANIHLMGLVTKGNTTTSFLGLGVEPDRERKMEFPVRIRDGADLPPEPPPEGEDRVLLATGLARTLGARPGDTVTVLSMAGEGSLNAVDLVVAGIYTTGVADLDTRMLKIHLASARRLLGTDRVSDLVVTLDRSSDSDRLRGEIEGRLRKIDPSVRLLGWRERAPFYDQVAALYSGVFWFLGAIIFVLVVLSASNTLLMSILERVREIGTLLAIGTSRAQVTILIVAEALWLGLIGAVVGDLLGLILIVVINAAEIEMPPPPGAVSGIVLELSPVPAAFLGTIALMLVVLGLASIAPTVKVLRLRIVEALGHV